MGRPRQMSDDDILQAARAVFLEHGARAPVSLVAERLGVSQAALFQRVGSKDRLLRSALAAGAPRCMMALREGPDAQRSERAQLVDMLADLAAFFDEIVPALVVLRAAGVAIDSGPVPPPVVLRELFAGWLRRSTLGIASPSAVAELLLGALEARCFNRHVGGPEYAPGDDRAVIRRLVVALLPRRAR